MKLRKGFGQQGGSFLPIVESKTEKMQGEGQLTSLTSLGQHQTCRALSTRTLSTQWKSDLFFPAARKSPGKGWTSSWEELQNPLTLCLQVLFGPSSQAMKDGTFISKCLINIFHRNAQDIKRYSNETQGRAHPTKKLPEQPGIQNLPEITEIPKVHGQQNECYCPFLIWSLRSLGKASQRKSV